MFPLIIHKKWNFTQKGIYLPFILPPLLESPLLQNLHLLWDVSCTLESNSVIYKMFSQDAVFNNHFSPVWNISFRTMELQTYGSSMFLSVLTSSLTLSWRGPYHIVTSPLICRENQWTGFYMIGTSVMKELSQSPKLVETLFKVNIGVFSGCFLQPR